MTDFNSLAAVRVRNCLISRNLIALSISLLCLGGESSADQIVNIKLYSSVECEPGLIRLDHIAHITGPDVDHMRSVSQLDLCQLELKQTKSLTREAIQLRLSLAGVKLSSIRWSGARTLTIRSRQVELDLCTRIEREIEDKVSQQIGRSREDLRIRFLRPLQELFAIDKKTSSRLQPEVILPAGQLVGKATIDLRLLDDRDIIVSRSVPLEIAVKQSEVRIAKFVRRHETLTAEHLAQYESFFTERRENIAPDEVYGRVARKDLRVGDRFKLSDLLPPAKTTPQEIVVRPRDAIRLIARHKNLEYVVPQAEAMQSGKIGQIIRVRNLQSNRVVNARLVSQDEAIVDLQ